MANKVLIMGGGGHVGTVLAKRLLDSGYQVKVLDTFWFGDFLPVHSNISKIQADIRDQRLVDQALKDVDTVIQLACLSNDPTSNLDPDLTKAINYTACRNVIHQAKRKGVQRFIYASSASVYGVRDEANITEDMVLVPITLYSKYKAEVEQELFSVGDGNFTTVAVRNSTVCGYSPRMRLDTIVNIFVMVALEKGAITVEGGQQLRPLICMSDLVDFYQLLLEVEKGRIHQQSFNVSAENYKVLDVAKMVQEKIPCELNFMDWTDPRSYHVSTEKVFKILGYRPTRTIADAIDEVKEAFEKNMIDPGDSRCYNIRHLKWLMENGKEREIRWGTSLSNQSVAGM